MKSVRASSFCPGIWFASWRRQPGPLRPRSRLVRVSHCETIRNALVQLRSVRLISLLGSTNTAKGSRSLRRITPCTQPALERWTCTLIFPLFFEVVFERNESPARPRPLPAAPPPPTTWAFHTYVSASGVVDQYPGVCRSSVLTSGRTLACIMNAVPFPDACFVRWRQMQRANHKTPCCPISAHYYIRDNACRCVLFEFVPKVHLTGVLSFNVGKNATRRVTPAFWVRPYYSVQN